MMHWYSYENANVHRGIYQLAESATTRYESARSTIASFIGAYSDEVVFVPGTTAGINTFASAWAIKNLKKGDQIVLTQLEHHSNIVPWQMIADQTEAQLVYIPVNEQGQLIINHLDSIINEKTKLVTFSMASHAIGVDIPYEYILNRAHAVGATTLIDAAQAVAHQAIDVKKLNVDALVFSAHKMYGPTGIGALYINRRLHADLSPFLTGGGMIASVESLRSQFQRMPYLLEAGTPAIAQAIGFAAAVNFIKKYMPFEQIIAYEKELSFYLRSQLVKIPHVTLLGDRESHSHVTSFIIENMHAHDGAAFLDSSNICVRAGSHCAQVLAKALSKEAWIRISIASYTSFQEIDFFIDQLKKLVALNCKI
jgi:cysteine desulfurase/selenocysteine lyase